MSFESRTPDGVVNYPLGRDAKGYCIFTADGYMSVAVMSSKRPRYVSGDLLGGSTEEKVAAAETYITYSGRYETRGNKLIVHCEVSFFPNWVGEDQVRFFELNENRLNLSTALILVKGKEMASYLTWERVTAD